MIEEISRAWNFIDNWLLGNAPQLFDTLQAGATDEMIQQTENQLEICFPEDIKASYRIHNGQIDGSEGLINGRCLLSLNEMIKQWDIWMELTRDGEADWHSLWIPITHDYGGNHYCLDLDPNLDTEVGRIIYVFHETVPKIEEVIASSFQEFLTQLSKDLENNNYIFSEEENTLTEHYDF